jgi:hypothetical protein
MWDHKLESEEHRSLSARGIAKSETLTRFYSNYFEIEDLKKAINESHFEAKKIFELAKELQGDPHNSTAYLETVELNRMLIGLYKLLQGHHEFTLPARAMEDFAR